MATKLSNPRLLKISIHTLRHWKATDLYHKTKDILYIKDYLGHKNIETTMKYITIERQIYCSPATEEFRTRVATTVEEDRELLEAGFEYVTERDGAKIYRKRK